MLATIVTIALFFTTILPLTWLAMFAPEEMKVRQMYERVNSPKFFVGLGVPKLVYDEPANNTGAPDWAFWQKRRAKRSKPTWDGDRSSVPT